jgi:hypothetical protein
MNLPISGRKLAKIRGDISQEALAFDATRILKSMQRGSSVSIGKGTISHLETGRGKDLDKDKTIAICKL